MLQDAGDDTRQRQRCKAGVDGTRIALHLPAGIAQEPLDQAAGRAEFTTDDGRAQRETARPADLAKELGAPIQVFSIGTIRLCVLTLAAGEDAIGADMDQTDAGGAAEIGQAMRKERIDS